MKRYSYLLALAVAVGLVFCGCSRSPETGPAAGLQPSEQQRASAVQKLEAEMEAILAQYEELEQRAEELEGQVQAALSEDDEASASELMEQISELEEELEALERRQEKLMDELTKLGGTDAEGEETPRAP